MATESASSATIELLQKLPRDASSYVFHRIGGKKAGAPHERMVFTYLMELLGQKGKATTHGFRSSFRDWAGETTAFPHDVCEAALAHIRGNKTVQAYARGDLFNKRRQLMDQWSRYCLTPAAKGAAVVPLRSA